VGAFLGDVNSLLSRGRYQSPSPTFELVCNSALTTSEEGFATRIGARRWMEIESVHHFGADLTNQTQQVRETVPVASTTDQIDFKKQFIGSAVSAAPPPSSALL
jgi:hypothetical protein